MVRCIKVIPSDCLFAKREASTLLTSDSKSQHGVQTMRTLLISCNGEYDLGETPFGGLGEGRGRETPSVSQAVPPNTISEQACHFF